MANLLAIRAEKRAIVKMCQSYGNDSMAYSRDHFEKNKHEECCELQEGRLNFYESTKPDHNTTTTVMKIEKRRGTNILILRCGPGSRVVTFIEFDSKRVTDEWQEALCRYIDQPYEPVLRRVRSELPAAADRWRRKAMTQSTFPDIVVEPVHSDSEQEAPPEAPQEAPLEAHRDAPPVAPPEAPPEDPPAPPARPVARPSPQVLPREERVQSFTSETSETDSRPDSLRLRNANLSPRLANLYNNSVEEEYNLSDLQHLKFEDREGHVIVSEVMKANPLCNLHVGDTVLLRNACGFPMNARELTELIRTSIVLTIKRGGLVCTAREEGDEVTITFKGSQTVRLDTVDLIRRACTSPCHLYDAEKPEIRPKLSNLTITEINSIPVQIGSQAHQIDEIMRDALETSGRKLTLYVVPQSLLDRLDDDALS